MDLVFGYIGLILVLGIVSIFIVAILTPGYNPDDTWTEKEKKTCYIICRSLWLISTIILFYCYGLGEDSVLNDKENLEGFISFALFVMIIVVTWALAKGADRLYNKIKRLRTKP